MPSDQITLLVVILRSSAARVSCGCLLTVSLTLSIRLVLCVEKKRSKTSSDKTLVIQDAHLLSASQPTRVTSRAPAAAMADGNK